jgi:putative endonuclease
VFARLVFAVLQFRARKGLAEPLGTSSPSAVHYKKIRALRVGVRGETYAYWYLRQQGYKCIARNYTLPRCRGEIDIIAYDGPVLAFIEVKTRSVRESGHGSVLPSPEDAVNLQKQRSLLRMARQFLRRQRIESAAYRFDILAIESREGAPPTVRLHKDAFRPHYS